MVFVVEDNGYAESTSPDFHQSGVDVAKRADGFGMPGMSVDGFDFFAVYEAAGEAIERARAGGGPTLHRVQGASATTATSRATRRPTAAPGEVEELRRDARLPDRVLASA